MRSVIVAVCGLVCSVLWLGLLVATDFNLVAVSVGLLGALFVTSSPAMTRPNAVRTHRPH
jgi:hypothetical protein